MSARWIGKVVAMLGKYLNNGHKCLIPVPESANVMEIIEMMQQILEKASVVAMPFKVSLEKLMQKMLKSLGLMVRFPMQEFERVEKIFPEGLMGDLVEASKSGKGASALHDNFKSLRSNLRQFLTSANLSMPRRVKEILSDLVGDGADLSKFVKKEGLAPDQTGMETKPIDSPAKSDDSEVEDLEDSKEQIQKSNDDLKTELEKQIADCRQQVDALEKAQASKSEICGKLAGKLKKACETRLDSRTPVMIRNLKKQCRALDDIYGQNFVEIAVGASDDEKKWPKCDVKLVLLIEAFNETWSPGCQDQIKKTLISGVTTAYPEELCGCIREAPLDKFAKRAGIEAPEACSFQENGPSLKTFWKFCAEE